MALDGPLGLHLPGVRGLPRADDLHRTLCGGLHLPELPAHPEAGQVLLLLRPVHEERRVLAPLYVLHAAQRSSAPVRQPVPPPRRPRLGGRSRHGGEPRSAAALYPRWASGVDLLPRRRHRVLPHHRVHRDGARLRGPRGHHQELWGPRSGRELRLLRRGRCSHRPLRHVPGCRAGLTAEDPRVRIVLLDAHRYHRVPHHNRRRAERLRIREGHGGHGRTHGVPRRRLLLRDPGAPANGRREPLRQLAALHHPVRPDEPQVHVAGRRLEGVCGLLHERQRHRARARQEDRGRRHGRRGPLEHRERHPQARHQRRRHRVLHLWRGAEGPGLRPCQGARAGAGRGAGGDAPAVRAAGGEAHQPEPHAQEHAPSRGAGGRRRRAGARAGGGRRRAGRRGGGVRQFSARVTLAWSRPRCVFLNACSRPVCCGTSEAWFPRGF
mmetsp:Transcript_79335/g.221987  ORF Transcript_79335/g.221987 Transcript_79335/m.221987 type:complete len:438 (+) Transcript_79335:674-1987(+)